MLDENWTDLLLEELNSLFVRCDFDDRMQGD